MSPIVSTSGSGSRQSFRKTFDGTERAPTCCARSLSFDEAIRLNPKYAWAYATRGVVFEKKAICPERWQISIRRCDLSDAIAGRDRIRVAVVATAPTATPTTLAASPAREAPPTPLPVASPPARGRCKSLPYPYQGPPLGA